MQPILGKVLVVDDDSRSLAAIRAILEGPEVEIVLAQSGEDALRWVLREEFAVILLDVRMPLMDGYEVASLIRARARSSRTPIIFLTGLGRDDLHIFRGYSAGAVDFVFKPIEPLILKSKVDVFVDLYYKTEEIRRRAEHERILLLEHIQIREEKLLVEQALRRREEHQSIILRSLPIALYTQLRDAKSRLLAFASDNIELITGFSAKRFLSPGFWESRLQEEDRETVFRDFSSISRVGVATLEYRWRCADDEPHHFLDCAVVASNENGEQQEIVGMWLDVTERKELERQLIHTSKLEAVGRLTGGIAHDFNNMLSLVIGNLDMLSRSLDGHDSAQKRVNLAFEGAQRCADLASRLLSFSRKQPLKARVIDLCARLPEIVEFLKPALGGGIDFALDLDEALWPVFVDDNQLEAALVNLAVNARDAMPHGGKLTVSGVNNVARQMIQISVVDTGVGMSKDVADRVFEPFFTTKNDGAGTGLGLSMVYGFVRQSGGDVEIVSAPGTGTTIRLFLSRYRPTADGSEQDSIMVEDTPVERQRVLVVEDDCDVRQLIVSLFESLGYSVTNSENADFAHSLLERNSEFDVIVCDVNMPGSLNGVELARTVRARWPSIQVLLMSGDPSPPDEMSDFNFLAKPFELANLAAKVREMLKDTGERQQLGTDKLTGL